MIVYADNAATTRTSDRAVQAMLPYFTTEFGNPSSLHTINLPIKEVNPMIVYADNAATTRTSDRAVQAMLPYFTTEFGNPSSLHTHGQNAKEALETARESVAQALGCTPREIYFTSGGTESDNMAIRTAAYFGARKNKRHIISTTFEHHAVLHTLKRLEKEGFEVPPERSTSPPGGRSRTTWPSAPPPTSAPGRISVTSSPPPSTTMRGCTL